jgi:hypothetical protein
MHLLRLVQAVDGFNKRVVVGITLTPNGWFDTRLV